MHESMFLTQGHLFTLRENTHQKATQISSPTGAPKMTVQAVKTPKRRMSVLAGASALLGGALISAMLTATPAQAKQTGYRYNCKNGPQMTVIFIRNGNQYMARYVYDGPDSAMRTAQIAGHPDNGNFVDGGNRINILNNNPRTISYVEPTFQDRCTAFQKF